MGHGTEAATTDIRRVLHALRPVAVLGGFVLVWWCLMTGAAQADSKIQHGLETAKPVAGHVEKSRQAVRHHADRVLSTSKATVRKSPAAPISRVATATVRTHVAEVVETTRPAMAAAPVAPTLSAPKELVGAKQPVRESSTGQGETRSSHAKPQRSAAPSSGMPADATEGLADPAGTPLTGADRAAPSSPAGEGSGSTARTGPGNSGASAQPGSGTGVGAGVTENGLRLSAPTTHTSSTSLAVRHCAGPTYPPGSSPD